MRYTEGQVKRKIDTRNDINHWRPPLLNGLPNWFSALDLIMLIAYACLRAYNTNVRVSLSKYVHVHVIPFIWSSTSSIGYYEHPFKVHSTFDQLWTSVSSSNSHNVTEYPLRLFVLFYCLCFFFFSVNYIANWVIVPHRPNIRRRTVGVYGKGRKLTSVEIGIVD